MAALAARDFIAIMALYVFVYYGLARSAMRQLRTVDPDYYVKIGGTHGLGMGSSWAVGKMLFDQQLPKQSYPAGISRKIIGARRMLMGVPFAALGAIGLALLIDTFR